MRDVWRIFPANHRTGPNFRAGHDSFIVFARRVDGFSFAPFRIPIFPQRTMSYIL
jgi:hypothetical protein